MSLTDVFVVDGHEDVDGAFGAKHPETQQDEDLEEDASARPHVRQQETHLPSKVVPR